MSPPIYTPDGSEVSEIVLPDGSTASEVIGPDGNVVFEAGADIPDSAVNRWILDDVETGTATDSIGSANGTVNGPVSISGTYQGGIAADADGTDDLITITGSDVDPDGTVFDSGMAVGITIAGYSSSSTLESPLGSVTSVNNKEGFAVALNRNSAGTVEFFRGDGVNGGPFVRTSNAVINDTSKYRIFCGIGDGGSESDVSIWVNNSQQATTTTLSGTASNFSGLSDDLRLFANDDGGTPTDFFDGILDDVILYGVPPTAALAQSDYEIQPWS